MASVLTFTAAKLAKKIQKQAFSFKKIWQNGEKAVLLHPLFSYYALCIKN